ncbi:hypothetical protein M5D96_014152 [Drosophila gunungcola]|uniref:Uncharacterized protein n=1 Tax=Drosophila gunungcola TaxID=103775 RepID=A0A9P9Y9X1_9MUSC|nr:hypothetical protein M5D96_014152 [Drosophila gunungcola]
MCLPPTSACVCVHQSSRQRTALCHPSPLTDHLCRSPTRSGSGLARIDRFDLLWFFHTHLSLSMYLSFYVQFNSDDAKRRHILFIPFGNKYASVFR